MDYSKGAFRSETGRTRAQTRTHHGKATSPARREAPGAPLQLNYSTKARGSPQRVPSPLSLSLSPSLDSLRHQPSGAVRGPR